MQKATLFAFFSVLCASTLLVGPYSAVHSIWNLGEAIGHRQQHDRINTQIALKHRAEVCESTASVYRGVVAPPDVAPPVPAPGETRPGGPSSEGIISEEYKSAAEEIRDRIGQEEILFALKFSLVGAIMAVLFSMFKKQERDFFEKLVQKRRAAAFFAAALFTAAIIDMRLRFNDKIIESLGHWVWCVERTFPQHAVPWHGVAPWENFLFLQLDKGANPLMRYSSHLLTSLLYGVAVYLFIVMPRTVNRSTRAMLTHSGAVFFAILVSIALSHDCPYGHDWTLLGSAGTVVLGAAGLMFLSEAYRLRFVTSNACQLTARMVRQAEKRSVGGKPRLARRARLLRRTYDAASVLLEPARFTVEMLGRFEGDPARARKRLADLEIPMAKWRAVAAVARDWQSVRERMEKLSRVRSSGKLSRKRPTSRIRIVVRACCLWLGLRARWYEWTIARNLRPANVESVHAAEESLWTLYFDHCAERQSIPARGMARRRRAPIKLSVEPTNGVSPERRRPDDQA
ncbi:MAG TPA: hypothetical protein VN962_11645 [Polyangia bacterium]|nr:hypothetical protein [Polyangia bacterium]